MTSIWFIPPRRTIMAKKVSTRKSRKATKSETEAATKVVPAAPQVETPTPAPAPVLSVRQESIRRSVAGKFNKVVLSQIGGKECPRFYPMTWKERDTFMAKPENAPVRERYEAHMKSVGK
jgi:hypothetical protein